MLTTLYMVIVSLSVANVYCTNVRNDTVNNNNNTYYSSTEKYFDENSVTNGTKQPSQFQYFNADHELLDYTDAYRNAPDLIRRKGFPVETHEIVTSDGYILTNHRIPSKKPGAFPVYLAHGILCSSRDWLMQRGKYGLAYKIAEMGYDVWLGNARGNHYSLGHVNLSSSTKDYWNFSTDEMAHIDVYATIDYILNTTNQTSLSWIGYSLGTTMLFAGLSARPEYNAKVKFFAGLAPVTFRTHTTGRLALALAALAVPEEPLRTMLTTVDHGRIFPSQLVPQMHKYLPLLCTQFLDRPDHCGSSLEYMGGDCSPHDIDDGMHPIIFGGFPSSTSARVIVQQVQGIRVGSNKFRRYAYQTRENNRKKYGFSVPPEYDLTKFTVPTALFVGLNDVIATPADVERLVLRLPNVVHVENVALPLWSHFDFIFGKNAYPLVYVKVLELLKNHSPPY